MKLRGEKRIGVKIFSLVLVSFMFMSLVSAGVGIKRTEESFLVGENEEFCVNSYMAYNPFSGDSLVSIELSPELRHVVVVKESLSKNVPANTASNEAIPVEFCFKIPEVYEKDCAFGSFLCKQECGVEQVVYDGEVIMSSVPEGTGYGSATTASVSAPMRIKVRCDVSSRSYGLIYIIVALIAMIGFFGILKKKKGRKKSRK